MEIPMPHGIRQDGHMFNHLGSGHRSSPTTRTWTSNGVQYTTTNYSSPGVSFRTLSGSTNVPFQNSRPSARSTAGGGLLGSAVEILGDLLSAQQAQRLSGHPSPSGQASSKPRRVIIDDSSDDEDELIREDDADDKSRHRSMFSRIKDKLLDGKQQLPSSNSGSRSREHSRDRSPARRPRNEHKRRSYRTETREPTGHRRRHSQPWSAEFDYEGVTEDANPRPRESRPRRTSQPDPRIIEALMEAVEVERGAVRHYKQRLQSAARQPLTGSNHLQELVDHLKAHEESLTTAQNNLHEVTGGRRKGRPPRRSSHQSQPRSRGHVPHAQSRRVFEDDFVDPFASFGGSFFQASRSRHSDPMFRAFDEINSMGSFARAGFALHESIMEHMRQNANGPQFRFYTTGGGAAGPHTNSWRGEQNRHSVPNTGPQPTPRFAAFTTPMVPKQPPANVLKPTEAKSLFRTYNERWNTMSNTDHNIPYPTRGFRPDALLARDTIWAPLCRAEVATWSDETIMQANAQALYLGAVGLTPDYKEAPGTGSIEMSFDKSKASAAQVSELISMLKKEKTRWHSDRLGRRNEGSEVPNEALQTDERARAVFHAICGLMETAQ